MAIAIYVTVFPCNACPWLFPAVEFSLHFASTSLPAGVRIVLSAKRAHGSGPHTSTLLQWRLRSVDWRYFTCKQKALHLPGRVGRRDSKFSKLPTPQSRPYLWFAFVLLPFFTFLAIRSNSKGAQIYISEYKTHAARKRQVMVNKKYKIYQLIESIK